MEPLRLTEYSVAEAYKLPGRVVKLRALSDTIFATVQSGGRLMVFSASGASPKLLYEAEAGYKASGTCKGSFALVCTSREGDRVVFLNQDGVVAERRFSQKIGPVAFSGDHLFVLARAGLLKSSLLALNCLGEVVAEKQLNVVPQELASSGKLVSLSTVSGHITFQLAGSQLEEVYRDSEPIVNELRLFLFGADLLSVRRREVASLSRGWRRELPFSEPRVAQLGDAILVWEPKSPDLLSLSVRDGAVVWTSSLVDPVVNVLTGNGLVFAFLRRRLVVLDRLGHPRDFAYLPVPEVEEADFLGENLVFSLIDWVGIARKTAINPEVKLMRLQRIGGRPFLEAKIIVNTPSGRESLERVTVLASRERESVSARTEEKGFHTLLIPISPGENTVRVTVKQTVELMGQEFALESSQDLSVSVPESLGEIPELVGRILNRRFAIHEQLGQGGFAATYKARDILSDRLVAVKVFDPMYGDPATLVTEAYHAAKTAEKVNKGEKVVVEALEAGKFTVSSAVTGESEREVFALVQEYVDGGSLRGFIEGGYPLKRRLEVAARVAHKVAVLHEHGVVHGDLKPENVLLYSSMEPVLADLYTAVILDRFETARRLLKFAYTPVYAPPELMTQGVYSREGDVYSLAVTAVETITSSPPSPPNIPVPLLRQNLPEETVIALKEALNKEPKKRPKASELEEALAKALKHHSS